MNDSKINRLIDNVNFPQDFRDFSIDQLKQLSDELRAETINSVSKIGGHLGAGLGVVELTVALHHVFDTPRDQIVWDIGHQAYPHKIITGRKSRMHTLRQPGGLSGFLKRTESEYDTFGAGHSSTSISAGLGMAVARDLKGENNHVVAIIGDSSIAAGMAFEAMNHAGHLRNKLIVILNDNEMSIGPNVGALHKYLCRLMSSKQFLNARHIAKNMLHHMPQSVENFTKKAKKYAKDFVNGGNFFEEMGFHYVGPIDGHDLDQLIPILSNLRDDNHIESPIFIHLKTQKGKGFDSPVSCSENFHAVAKFDPETKIQIKAAALNPTYTKVFADTLCAIAKDDDKVVAITAGMPSGTGLNIFAKQFADKTFDVGIAEQHAVTFAAGLATQGIKPFVAIYSTFLQRAYDQVIHDVAIQKLPVRFILDRAGVVGADGPTHAGVYDLAYLGTVPGIVIMAPSDESELKNMIATSHTIDDMPSAIRFPRGEGYGADISAAAEILPIGRGAVRQKGEKIAIVSIGTRLQEAFKAALIIEQTYGFVPTVIDARFMKPLDEALLTETALTHESIITVEEGSIGGFGSHAHQFLSQAGLLDSGLKFRALFLPDVYIEHNNPHAMYEAAGVNASGIFAAAKSLLGEKYNSSKCA